MTYNSLSFFPFFACFIILYLLMPKIWLRQVIILVGSLLFYIYAGGSQALIVVVFTSLIVYIISRCMDKIYAGYEQEKEGLTPKESAALFASYKKRSKKFLLLALFLIIGTLVYVKAAKLFGFTQVDNLSDLLTAKTFLVPLGISYYTFSSVGYLLDIYWKKAKCERNYFRLLLCMTYFPHIVQGPISHYDKLAKQLNALPKFSYERVCLGIQRMIWGYFKKLVVADRIALFTSTVFTSMEKYAGVEILVAVIFCAIELYADFSGCMDIVCGAAQTMGITLEENFKQPFFSKSAAEFWRRWHITLGAWFKDYVYMPIAMSPRFMKASVNIRKKHGNRTGQIFSSAIPLAVVWFLTGLWHGTGPDYIVWGCYWGVLIILSTVLAPELKKLTEKLHIDTSGFGFQFFQMTRTFLLFCIGRMLTVTGSLEGFSLLVSRLFTKAKLWAFFNGGLYKQGLNQKNFYVVLFGILLIWAADMLQARIKIRETLAKQPIVFRWIIYYAAIFIVLVFGKYGTAFDASNFIYGGF